MLINGRMFKSIPNNVILISSKQANFLYITEHVFEDPRTSKRIAQDEILVLLHFNF